MEVGRCVHVGGQVEEEVVKWACIEVVVTYN
jgi:hypothetical protein